MKKIYFLEKKRPGVGSDLKWFSGREKNDHRAQTHSPWIWSHTLICSQTRYQLRYVARYVAKSKMRKEE